jgi:hypothetical protein
MPYVSAPITPAALELASWHVKWQDLHAFGECPRCHDIMPFDWELDYVAMNISDGERSVTRPVTCACEVTHPNTPEHKTGCGASWVARFYEDATGGRTAPQEDPRLVAAARALEAAGRDAETRLRTAAEKWVGGVAAVLALFGIAGTVAGGKILDNLSDGDRKSVVWLTVAAVTVAVVAVVFSYLAAYGWPKVIEMNDAKLLEWHEGRRNRLRNIASRLRWAVVAAVLSIGLLTSAAAVAWLYPSSISNTTLKVTANDNSVTCGTLLSAKTAGVVQIRVADGTVKAVPLGTVDKLESVKSC